MGSFFSAQPKEAPGCTYSTSRRCVGERRSGGPFWEILCITYTYAKARCSLEISQKGIAKRVHNLSIALLDKDINNGTTNVVVDAEVVVTAVSNSNSICNSRMSVRNCNLAPHKGVLENWSESFNSVEAIRYFTPTRHGMLSLTTPVNVPNTTTSGTITHQFATKDSDDDAGFCVEVKFKMEASKGLRLHVDGPKLRPNICFTDHIEIDLGGDDDAGPGPEPVIRTSLPSKGLSVHVDGPKLRPNICFTDHIEIDVGGGDDGGPRPEPVIRTSLPSDSSQKTPINKHGHGPIPNSRNTQFHSHPPIGDGRISASSLARLGKEGFDLIEKCYNNPQPHKPNQYRGNSRATISANSNGPTMSYRSGAHMIMYHSHERREGPPIKC